MPRVVALCCAFLLLGACERGQRGVQLHASDAIPDRLSAWGVVLVDDDTFELNDAVVPYELNTPLFSDYALKLRTVWMPEGAAAVYNEDRELKFPVGTIISKTFHYEKAADRSALSFTVIKADRESKLDSNGQLGLDDYMLVETRLLVRYADGWRAYPYVWNTEQTEAYLEIAGDMRTLDLVADGDSERIVYVVPDVNQCAGCHTPDHSSKALRPIGPKAWQLNRAYEYRGVSANQLEHWTTIGLLSGLDREPPSGARWSEPGTVSPETRAKAYLDVNCAHCHNPSGAADTSALHLNIDAPVDRLHGVCKPPVAVGRGSGDLTYDIFPGRPQESILVYRMQHSDPAIAMPELGRSAVHAEGVAAVGDWIAGLPGSC